MYFRLSESLKRRFVSELRLFWAQHPRYRDIVDHIQGKYSFKERPQYGIIVKNSGGNRVDLSADNYVGTVISYVSLAKVKNYPGVAIEWVREDGRAIQENRGVFPSAPGIYFIELTEDDQFYVDQLLNVYREPVTMVDSLTGQLQGIPLTGTLRLYEMPQGYLLQENINYTLTRDSSGNLTGEIVLTSALTGGRILSADYRMPGLTTGPHTLYPGRADNKAIPGVVLAFGRRNEKGDRLAVVVEQLRCPTALEYGGKWGLTLDFDIVTRDVNSQQEIADQTVIYIWGILRPYLSSEGIEITDLSLGGESEEPYDETGDDYFYNASFSLTVETEWAVHVPINVYIRQAAPLTVEQARIAAALTDDQIGQFQNNLRVLESLGLESVVDPFFAGRTSTFETIK